MDATGDVKVRVTGDRWKCDDAVWLDAPDGRVRRSSVPNIPNGEREANSRVHRLQERADEMSDISPQNSGRRLCSRGRNVPSLRQSPSHYSPRSHRSRRKLPWPRPGMAATSWLLIFRLVRAFPALRAMCHMVGRLFYCDDF